MVTLPPTPVYVDADVTRLAQVFSNLLNNSAKYTPDGGHIYLTAERQGTDAVIAVRDNGMGIPAKMLPHIFEMFTQVDRTLERAQGGLGIGLTLVKRLVEMHGGSVRVHSDGKGQGSEFVVRLPEVYVRAEQASPRATGVGGATTTLHARHRILVADDNEDAAKTLAMILRIMGNDVQVAHDGLAAVKAAGEFRPDTVFLDIGMPRLNGYDAARQIREHPEGKDIVLIALTGWGQEEDKRRSQEAGFDLHMVKPVDPAALEKLFVDVPQSKE
jgi:CheY-like chemotaxis protein